MLTEALIPRISTVEFTKWLNGLLTLHGNETGTGAGVGLGLMGANIAGSVHTYLFEIRRPCLQYERVRL